MMASSQ